LLNVEANVEVDFTALEALDELREELVRGGTILALARAKQDLLDDLEAFGLAARSGPMQGGSAGPDPSRSDRDPYR
jgi:MFS superfamily sulfate permease-like transporter